MCSFLNVCLAFYFYEYIDLDDNLKYCLQYFNVGLPFYISDQHDRLEW